jgi:hypothetical protein
MDIDLALAKLDKTYYYSCPNHDYDSLVMLDSRPKPSLSQLQAAWLQWLNEEAKSNAMAKLELNAEKERLKYITPGSGKSMAYQQQQREVERWEDGQTNPKKFPVATEYALKLNMTVTAVLTMWQTNINNWLIVGSKIEANLAKAKSDLTNMVVTSQAELDSFIASVNWSN